MKKLKYFFCCGLLLVTTFIQANNIQVTNVALREQNTAAKTLNVQFNLSWENSWRTSTGPANWDAAWVFVKFRVGNGDWQHATLSSLPEDHTAPFTPVASTITPSTDGKGAFIYRSADGTGTFTLTNVKLNWLYGTDGVTDIATVRVRVFAIEMVYVLQGSFFVGSGGTESGSFTDGAWTSGATIPLKIISEDVLTIEKSNGNLWGTSSSGDRTIGGTGSLSESFPKGFSAFYCMKYELSQAQYRDFLNLLTRTQQVSRFSPLTLGHFFSLATDLEQTIPSTRNGIKFLSDPGDPLPRVFACDHDNDNNPNESTDGEWIACWLNWMDGAAYADWAGLRPMTELEFEKACRGNQDPVPNEYPWGTTTIAMNDYGISNRFQNNETLTLQNNVGNAWYDGTYSSGNLGPLRVGIFARSTTSRTASGATYYGIMEMAGNVREICVRVSNNAGRNFTGLHGDGNLSANGHANVSFWPGISNGEVTGSSGVGFRGGLVTSTGERLRVSDREDSGESASTRAYSSGFRAVRTAPN